MNAHHHPAEARHAGIQGCSRARHRGGPACAESARGGDSARSRGGGRRAEPEGRKLARRAEGERLLPGAGRRGGGGGQSPELRHHPGRGATVLQRVWLPVLWQSGQRREGQLREQPSTGAKRGRGSMRRTEITARSKGLATVLKKCEPPRLRLWRPHQGVAV
eukprot:5344217-Prymnesium_polylepis.2